MVSIMELVPSISMVCKNPLRVIDNIYPNSTKNNGKVMEERNNGRQRVSID